MPKTCSRSVLALGISLILTACGGAPVISDSQGTDLMAVGQAVTLVNLRPDPVRKRLSAVNYQQAGLIPRCTPVQLLEADDETLRFKDLRTDVEYSYVWYSAAAESFGAHLSRVFGRACDPEALRNLSAVDQAGIRAAKADVGMSKAAVLLAIGYPPQHRTPSLEDNLWTYWKNRFDRFVLEFQNGRVTRVAD